MPLPYIRWDAIESPWLICESHISHWLFPLCHTHVQQQYTLYNVTKIYFIHWTMCTAHTTHIHQKYKYFFFILQSEHHQTNKFSIHKTLYIFIDDGHCFCISFSLIRAEKKAGFWLNVRWFSFRIRVSYDSKWYRITSIYNRGQDTYIICLPKL